MNARVFANTTSLSLTSDLDGSEFVAPVIPAGQDVYLSFRTSKEIEGTGLPDDRVIRAVSLRMGWSGLAPEQGTYQLAIAIGATTATTASILYNATTAQVAAAINAAILSPLAALHPCTVTEHLDGRRIVFADNTLEPGITAADNALWPLSFVDIDAIEFDAGWAWMLDLRQAPVAETVGAYALVPAAPSVEELQPGLTLDGVATNSVQRLTIPAEFSGGSFLLTRSVKSSPLPSPPTLAQVTAALAQIADSGGTFAVTEVSGGVYIEFQGSMAGEPQDEIGIEVFEAPAVEHLIRLSTATAGVRELMRNADAAGRVELPLNLDFEIADPVLANVWERKIIAVAVTLSQPVSDGTRNVAADLRWDQPLSRKDYRRHSTDAIVIGNRGMRFVFGDGVATSFALAHNLMTNLRTVTANPTTNKLTSAGHNYQDLDPVTLATSTTLPAPLATTATYFVLNASTDDFQLAMTPNGAPIDLTTVGTGTHTARLKDGTVDGVLVEVWETGGGKQRLAQNAYTAVETSVDILTLSGFPSIPTPGQYKALVMTYGRPATYQAHNHAIDETPEAKLRIEALEARVAVLESYGPGTFGSPASTSSGRAQKAIPHFVFVYPIIGRGATVTLAPGARLAMIPPTSLPRFAPRLYPAVHDAAVTALGTTLDGDVRIPIAPVEGDIANVYENQTAEEVLLDVGSILPGQFAATDGESWYPVEKYAAGESSFYPSHLARVLYEDMVQADELPLGGAMELRIPLELAVLIGNATVHCQIVIETAAIVADTTPGTPGSNLASEDWVETPHLAQNLILTAAPREYVVGYRVSRSSAGVLAADQLKFGKWTASTAPAAAAFRIRARLNRLDQPNAITAPAGLIAVTGGTPFADSNSPDSSANVGFLTILS